MKDSVIVTDLDDTLVSTHLRQYSCIRDYLAGDAVEFVDFESYYQLRRSNQFSNTQLLQYLNIQPDWDAFRSYYLAEIESDHYLALDQLIVDAALLKQVIEKGYRLFLLSLRSNTVASKAQLERLDIAQLFHEVQFLPHDAETNPKLAYLSKWKSEQQLEAFCGDSKTDYEAARQLNINFVQVHTSLYRLPDFEGARHFENINQYFLSLL